jgi:chemotaxis protein methyltransferase CheR
VAFLAPTLADEGDAVAPLQLLVRAYANLGQAATALTWCERLLARARLDPGAHYLHALILLELARLADAITAVKRAVYLDHTFIMAHVTLGTLLQAHGDSAKALRHLNNASALLAAVPPEEIVPESEGLTAARLTALVEHLRAKEDRHD